MRVVHCLLTRRLITVQPHPVESDALFLREFSLSALYHERRFALIGTEARDIKRKGEFTGSVELTFYDFSTHRLAPEVSAQTVSALTGAVYQPSHGRQARIDEFQSPPHLTHA